MWKEALMRGRVRKWAPVLAMLALPLAAIGIFARDLAAQLKSLPFEVIEGPSAWVPFVASVEVSHPGKAPTHGRFYRAGDGSERLDTGPSLEDIRVIFIKNVAQRLTFSGNPRRNEWTQQPFVPRREPPVGFKLPTWTMHPYKLAILKGQSGAVNASEGFSAYSVRTESGIVTLKVPELNFFDAVRQRPDGRYEIYSDIELIQPDWRVFEPPVGAVLRSRERTDTPSAPTVVAPTTHTNH
jgi:hypothetical protein